MPDVDQLAILNTILGCYAYGTIKAELKLNAKSKAYSRITCEESSKKWFKKLKELDISVESKDHPWDSIEIYIEAFDKLMFLSKNDFVIEKDDQQMLITVPRCPYSIGCSYLLKEGIKGFCCMRVGLLQMAGEKSGKELISQTEIDPGNCKITFNIKE